MSVVNEMLAERGRVSALAREMRQPVQTVHSWKATDHIPHWRRPKVLDAVRSLGWPLTDEAVLYLAAEPAV